MSDDCLDELSKSCLLEFVHFMTGDRLGHGMSRVVFDHPTDPTKVIKIENSRYHFQNVLEWQFWNDNSAAKGIAKWLAPCHAISYNGTFLIQTKALDLQPNQFPKHLPAFLTDHKAANFGMIGKQVVCRDYGFTNTQLNTRMRKFSP